MCPACLLASACLPVPCGGSISLFFNPSSPYILYDVGKGGFHCSVLLILSFFPPFSRCLAFYTACGRHKWAFLLFSFLPSLLEGLSHAGGAEASRHFAEYNLRVFFLNWCDHLLLLSTGRARSLSKAGMASCGNVHSLGRLPMPP